MLRFTAVTHIYAVLVGPRELNVSTQSALLLNLATQWLLDVLICNWLGTYLGGFQTDTFRVLDSNPLPGMKTCQYFDVKVGLSSYTSHRGSSPVITFGSITNGEASGRLVDSGPRLSVPCNSFRLTTSLPLNGRAAPTSSITSPSLCFWPSS